MNFEAGSRVAYTEDGVTYKGTVYRTSGEINYIDLDEPYDTKLGWFTSTMIVRSCDLIDI